MYGARKGKDVVRYSAISGKPIKLKLERSLKDKNDELNRAELLSWLNSASSY